MGNAYVVVPDGLKADRSGRALPEPSFIYRAVLDWVAYTAKQGDTIYLAPANTFGGSVSEHEAAAAYLSDKTTANVVAPVVDNSKYIDTRGNARLLRRHLESIGAWPLERAILVSYFLHLPRSRIVFRQEGFRSIDFGSVKLPHYPGSVMGERLTKEPVVRRLWYYRYPQMHLFYEFAASAASLIRVI